MSTLQQSLGSQVRPLRISQRHGDWAEYCAVIPQWQSNMSYRRPKDRFLQDTWQETRIRSGILHRHLLFFISVHQKNLL